MERLFFRLAGISGGLAVVLGAFGAHTLQGKIEPQLLGAFEVGVRYQMYHALALLGVDAASTRWSASKMLTAAGWSFVVGLGMCSRRVHL